MDRRSFLIQASAVAAAAFCSRSMSAQSLPAVPAELTLPKSPHRRMFH